MKTKTIILTIVLLSIASFFATAGLVWVVCWGFGWAWSWKISIAAWALLLLLSSTFNTRRRNK